MLTRQEGERLAEAIHALRPDWPTGSLLTFIGNRRTRPLIDLSLELTYVALDPDTKSPARIDVDGPWKRLNPLARTGAQHREITDADCGICSRPAGLHSPLSADPHEWEPRNARGAGEKPTPERRAAIDAANEAAQIKVTAAKEAAETKRKTQSVDDVLARHQPTEET